MFTNLPDVPSVISFICAPQQREYALPFKFFADTDISATLYTGATGTPLILTTHYVMTGAGLDAGMKITLTFGPAGGQVLYVERRTPQDRMTNYPLTGPFRVQSLNTELFRHIAMIQELGDGIVGLNNNLANKVSKSGDIMSGQLTMRWHDPLIVLDRESGGVARIAGQLNGVVRWQVNLGNESGNFEIHAFNELGVITRTPLTITSTGAVFLSDDPTDPSNIATKDYVNLADAAIYSALNSKVNEAQSNGVRYVRRNAAWEPAAIQTDAPTDGLQYARQNGGWVQVTDPGSSITDMPPSTATPTVNGQVTLEATTNELLTWKYKGTDGVVRSFEMPLVEVSGPAPPSGDGEMDFTTEDASGLIAVLAEE